MKTNKESSSNLWRRTSLFVVLVAVFVLASTLVLVVDNGDDAVAETNDECFEYSLDGEKKEASVLGLTTFGETQTSLVVPDTIIDTGETYKVVSILEGAFKDNTVFTDFTIGANVTLIDTDAFSGCTKLGSINIPASVTEIKGGAFYGCTGLKEVTFADSSNLSKIGLMAFSGCTKLASFTFPEKVDVIPGNVLQGCMSLSSVDILGSVTAINNYAFKGCSSLTSIDIPDTVATMGTEVFSGCTALEEVSISSESKLSKIGSQAFEGCSSLTSIYIPAGVSVIEDSTFKGCSSLTSIDIHSKVAKIGEYAFKGCTALKEVINASGVTEIGEGAFSGCVKLETFTIPAGVTVISQYTFENCRSLGTIAIPAGVTEIGSCAFDGCISIKSVTFASDNKLSTIGEYAFAQCMKLESIAIPNGVSAIDQYTFADCVALKAINFGTGVQSIGNSAFIGCKSLLDISIPDSVTRIDSNAFAECTGAKAITIGVNVNSIDNYAFKGCTAVTKIVFNATSLTGLLENSCIFENVGTLGSGIEVVFGTDVKKIPDYLFGSVNQAPLIKSLVIGDNITTIGAGAFYKCSNLKTLVIGKNVATIGDYAFHDCTGLTKVVFNATSLTGLRADSYIFNNAGAKGIGMEVVFGNDVKTIPDYLFCVAEGYSAKILSLTIGDNISSIGQYAFSGCVIETISIGKNVATIGDSAFEGCTGIAKIRFDATSVKDLAEGNAVFKNIKASDDGLIIVFASDVTSIPAYLFPGIKDQSVKVIITKSVKTIGAHAFDGTEISTLVIGSGVTTIGDYAFKDTKIVRLVFNAKNVADFGADNMIFSGAGNAGGMEVVFGDEVTNVPAYMFSSNSGDYVTPSIAKVTFGSKVATIGKFAFDGCGFFVLNIPSSVTSIGEGAFKDCSHLILIRYNAVNCACGTGVFDGAGAQNLELVIGTTVKVLPDVFKGNAMISKVLFTKGLVTISDSAFEGCTGIKAVEISPGVTTIGARAFYGCTGILFVDIPGTVTTFGNLAFGGCPSIVSFVFGNFANTTVVGDHVFSWEPESANADPVDYVFLKFGYNHVFTQLEVRSGFFNGHLYTIGPGETGASYHGLITLDANGGKCDVFMVYTDSYGKTQLPTPTREGYVFGGWYLGDVLVTDATEFGDNATLVAKWQTPAKEEKNDMSLVIAAIAVIVIIALLAVAVKVKKQ